MTMSVCKDMDDSINDIKWENVRDDNGNIYQIGRDKNGNFAGMIYCPYIPEFFNDETLIKEKRNELPE